MKRIVLLLMAVLAIASCSKNDKDEERLPEIIVSNNPISVKIGVPEDITIRLNEPKWHIKRVEIEDDRIARVADKHSNYRIFGVIKGTTNLLIIASNSQKDITKKIPIIVNDVEAQSLSLPNELSITVGSIKLIQYSITPTNATENIEWTTSDKNIAIVERGELTGLKSGICTITATIGKLKSSCRVIVKDIEVDVIKLKDYPKGWLEFQYSKNLGGDDHIEYSNIKLYENQRVSLNVVFEPQNAKDKNVIWTSSNAEYVEVKDGVLIAKKPIESEVTIKGTLANGKYLELKVKSVKILDDYLIDNVRLETSTGYSLGSNTPTKTMYCYFHNETGLKIKVHSVEIIEAITNTSLTTIDYNTFEEKVEYFTNPIPIGREYTFIYKWKFSYNDKIYFKEARSDRR